MEKRLPFGQDCRDERIAREARRLWKPMMAPTKSQRWIAAQ